MPNTKPTEEMIEAGRKALWDRDGGLGIDDYGKAAQDCYLAMSASQPVDEACPRYQLRGGAPLPKPCGNCNCRFRELSRAQPVDTGESFQDFVNPITPPLDSEAVERVRKFVDGLEAMRDPTVVRNGRSVKTSDLRALLNLAKPVGGRE